MNPWKQYKPLSENYWDRMSPHMYKSGALPKGVYDYALMDTVRLFKDFFLLPNERNSLPLLVVGNDDFSNGKYNEKLLKNDLRSFTFYRL